MVSTSAAPIRGPCSCGSESVIGPKRSRIDCDARARRAVSPTSHLSLISTTMTVYGFSPYRPDFVAIAAVYPTEAVVDIRPWMGGVAETRGSTVAGMDIVSCAGTMLVGRATPKRVDTVSIGSLGQAMVRAEGLCFGGGHPAMDRAVVLKICWSCDVLGHELVVDIGVDRLRAESRKESLPVLLDADVVLFLRADYELVALDEADRRESDCPDDADVVDFDRQVAPELVERERHVVALGDADVEGEKHPVTVRLDTSPVRDPFHRWLPC